jgi:hypothetical protein
VKTKSELVNINSAQVSTKGDLRPTSLTALGLDYQIAVTPDSNSGSGFADGTVKTTFAGSIMEARMPNDAPALLDTDTIHTPAATNSWKDSASVSGGIKNMQKSFTYDTGVAYT